MAKRRKWTEEQRAAARERLAAGREKARATREAAPEHDPFADAPPPKEPDLPDRRYGTQRSELDRLLLWRETTLNMLRTVHRQVFEVCTCKSKAYLMRCDRYSCRHLLDATSKLFDLAAEEGLLPPLNLQKPRLEPGAPLRPFDSSRDPRAQLSETIYPEQRQRDGEGMPVLPAGRGEPPTMPGPRTYHIG